jgi:hypothetical protein
MAKDLVKRFIKKDGMTRMSIYRDDYAENPRDMTDEPLHCEDWSRGYSIMNKQERETKSENACKWIRYMLERYGNIKEIFKVLRENAKAEKHEEDDDALVYDASRHEWILKCWIARWTDYSGEIHGNCWSEEVSWEIKLKDLDASDIVPYLSDDMIEEFSDEKYFTDGIKMMSYSFGYYGDISFSHKFSTDSEGICWLEKDEFLEYSGNNEEYWNGKSLDEIEFLLDELKAWGDNDVYGYVVEDAVKYKTTRKCLSGNGEDEEYEETEWEEKGLNSCWGFYGDIDKVTPYMFDNAGLKQEDFEEENV